MKKKCLITGGAGYVGSALTKYLLRKGYDIKIFDACYFGKKSLKQVINKIELVEGDIRTPPKDLFKGVESVVHLAGFSNDPMAEFDPASNKIINTKASVDLAKKAKKDGVERFVYASTASIYDLGIGEGDWLKDETALVHPQHHYSLSKFRAEEDLNMLVDDNFCITSLRKGTIYGYSPRMRFDLVVNVMLKYALELGTIKVFCKGVQWRPLLNINDAVVAYYKTLTASKSNINGEVFNIVSTNIQMKHLAVKMQKILNEVLGLEVKVVYEQDDKQDRSYRMIGKKAKDVLGFVPKPDLKKSVTDMVYWINKEKIYEKFNDPIYYNIKWMEPILKDVGGVS